MDLLSGRVSLLRFQRASFSSIEMPFRHLRVNYMRVSKAVYSNMNTKLATSWTSVEDYSREGGHVTEHNGESIVTLNVEHITTQV